MVIVCVLRRRVGGRGTRAPGIGVCEQGQWDGRVALGRDRGSESCGRAGSLFPRNLAYQFVGGHIAPVLNTATLVIALHYVELLQSDRLSGGRHAQDRPPVCVPGGRSV